MQINTSYEFGPPPLRTFRRLTQCAEDDWPASVLFAAPNGGDRQLILCVRFRPLKVTASEFPATTATTL